MTTSITTATTAANEAILAELGTEMDHFRTRIARLSMQTSGTLTDMFNPLGPVNEDIIDIPSIEAAPYELEMIPAVRTDVASLELVAA